MQKSNAKEESKGAEEQQKEDKSRVKIPISNESKKTNIS